VFSVKSWLGAGFDQMRIWSNAQIDQMPLHYLFIKTNRPGKSNGWRPIRMHENRALREWNFKKCVVGIGLNVLFLSNYRQVLKRHEILAIY